MWRDQRVDVLLAAVADLGMSMSRAAAGELIDERVQFVAAQMRVSEPTARRYLTDEAVRGLAQSIAFSLVEETPGADLFSVPRDARIPVRLVGRSARVWPKRSDCGWSSATTCSTLVMRSRSSPTASLS